MLLNLLINRLTPAIFSQLNNDIQSVVKSIGTKYGNRRQFLAQQITSGVHLSHSLHVISFSTKDGIIKAPSANRLIPLLA
jgi:uncharacterized protein YheU (UPF0270 family)